MVNINFFGGPGTGKSTTASGLFHLMKKEGYKVEYVTEYAKDLVYSKSFYEIKDQLYIFAKQHHPWFKLEKQVDFTINDGPFLIGLLYLQDTPHIPRKELEQLMIKMWNSYENVNFLLRRTKYNYQSYGRLETEEEALQKDKEIVQLLQKHNIQYIEAPIKENTHEEVLKHIKAMFPKK